MCWLAERLGIERLTKADVVLPTEQYFPDPYSGTEEDARRVLERVCSYMALEGRRLDLEVCGDEQMPGAVGHYEAGDRVVIRVVESQLGELQGLVATLAHEVSHHVLLGGRLLTADVEDHEWVTDLLPVFLGLGIFAANATVSQERHGGQRAIRKTGYLPSRMFGYGLALFAHMRGEWKPDWDTYLRLDAAASLQQGLRYLSKTDDALFHPTTVWNRRDYPSLDETLARLRSDSPTVRLATLWELRQQPLDAPEVLAAVTERLDDRDRCLPGEAAKTLATFGPAADAAVPALLRALEARDDRTRAGAAYALGVLQLQPERVVPELASLMEDENDKVVLAASTALRQFGSQAQAAAAHILPALTKALIDCDQKKIDNLTRTLLASLPDARQHVQDYFRQRDPELEQLAVLALAEHGTGSG